MIRTSILDEPELEFGAEMRHVDIRFGLTDYGPFDFDRDGEPKHIRVAIIGDTETVEGTSEWLEKCKSGIDAKPSRQPNLFPSFPGTGVEGAYRCELTAPEGMKKVLPNRSISKVLQKSYSEDNLEELINIFIAEIKELADANTKPDVILIALPLNVIEFVYSNTGSEDEGAHPDTLNFRGMLKSVSMKYRIPIQILWPTTFNPKIKIPRKIKKESDRRVQDDATRAWNFMTALYYKAGGLPWRVVRDSRKMRTSFVGISFYKSVDGDTVHTSTAQMFDERGEGLILRGGRAVESSEDRQPHLKKEDAHNLLANSLTVFRRTHGHYPARVVIHKSSLFNSEEQEGFDQALAERDIDYADYITITKTTTRLYRKGAYPPLRGSLVRFGKDRAILYTKGSVEFFRTYPGMYVPMPILLRCQKLDQPLADIARETLTLTKMNWNNTQFDGGLPVTLGAAKQVGDILKYVAEDQEIAPRYSFYM